MVQAVSHPKYVDNKPNAKLMSILTEILECDMAEKCQKEK